MPELIRSTRSPAYAAGANAGALYERDGLAYPQVGCVPAYGEKVVGERAHRYDFAIIKRLCVDV